MTMYIPGTSIVYLAYKTKVNTLELHPYKCQYIV